MLNSIPRRRRISFLLLAGCWLAVAGATSAQAKTPSLHFEPGIDIPSGLEPRVRFWIDVFSRYSQNEAVVHDREQPIVLAVVPLRTGSPEELEQIEERFQSLVAQVATVSLDDDDTLLAAFRAPLDPRWIAAARDRIRVQQGQREAFAAGLVNSQLYLTQVRSALRSVNLPGAIAYLPHVESSFNPGATSRDGAAGIWQLMPDTARRYLRVDGAVDERRDPYKATIAAAQYLRDAHDVLGTWPLAITAYNYGVGGTRRAVDAVGSSDLVEVIDHHSSPAFGFSCKNFYAQFLAAAHVAENQHYYFPALKMPPQTEYVVRKGDNLWDIARRHGVTVAAIRSANNLAKETRHLQLGQRLIING